MLFRSYAMTARRNFLVALSASLVGVPSLSRAQALPRPARIVLGYPPGGSIDAIARVLTEKMRPAYSSSVVVENHPGTRGAVVVGAMLRADADAWTRFWQPLPEPGFHDLLAMSRFGRAVIEGDLQPFMANLRYFKEVLEAPRRAMVAAGGAKS